MLIGVHISGHYSNAELAGEKGYCFDVTVIHVKHVQLYLILMLKKGVGVVSILLVKFEHTFQDDAEDFEGEEGIDEEDAISDEEGLDEQEEEDDRQPEGMSLIPIRFIGNIPYQ